LFGYARTWRLIGNFKGGIEIRSKIKEMEVKRMKGQENLFDNKMSLY
jgi:hypothetical protein